MKKYTDYDRINENRFNKNRGELMSIKEWRLLDTRVNDAFYNMAVDEALMKSCRNYKSPPVVRFYRWSPPGLSLGYNQEFTKEVDREACNLRGVDVVRRLTGGRAILHDDELTYSIIVRKDDGILPEGILESYKVISKGIIKGLKNTGLNAELKAIERGKKSPKGFSAACFDAPSWYEVIVGNKKLVGSAQTRQKGVILQHGSIPFSLDADMLFSILNIRDTEVRNRLKRRFMQKATAINQELGYKVNLNVFKESLKSGWEKVFAINLKNSELLPRERKWVIELMENKYRTEEWNAMK